MCWKTSWPRPLPSEDAPFVFAVGGLGVQGLGVRVAGVWGLGFRGLRYFFKGTLRVLQRGSRFGVRGFGFGVLDTPPRLLILISL